MDVFEFKDWEEVPVNFTGIVKFSNGHKAFFLNRKLHREDGPAYERTDGSKFWYLKGFPHRKDGPACEYADDSKEWWWKGIPIFIPGKVYLLQEAHCEPMELIPKEKLYIETIRIKHKHFSGAFFLKKYLTENDIIFLCDSFEEATNK
jgi:hypothetical protein